jgi:hypothetical protein
MCHQLEAPLRNALKQYRRDGIPVPVSVETAVEEVGRVAGEYRMSAGGGISAAGETTSFATIENVMNVDQMSEALHCKARNVRRLCGSGAFPAQKSGGRWLALWIDVEEYRNRRTR